MSSCADWKHTPLTAENENLLGISDEKTRLDASIDIACPAEIWAEALTNGAMLLSEKGDRDIMIPAWKRNHAAVSELLEDLNSYPDLPEGTHLIREPGAGGMSRWSVLENPDWAFTLFHDPVLVGRMTRALKKRAFYPTQEAYVLAQPLPVPAGVHIDAPSGSGIWFLRSNNEMVRYLKPGGPVLVLATLDV